MPDRPTSSPRSLLARLDPKLAPTTAQAPVQRSWYTLKEDTSLLERCGLTASCWFSAGVSMQLACRLRELEPALADRTIDVAELRMAKVWDRQFEFDKGKAGPEIERAPKARDPIGDAEWVLRTTMALGLRLVYMASKPTITKEWDWHTPWDLAAEIHVGALYTLYAQPEASVYRTWYTHARKVV